MMHFFRHSFIAFALVLTFANPICAEPPSLLPGPEENAAKEEQATKTAVYILGPAWIEQKKILSMEGQKLEQKISLINDPGVSSVWLKSLTIEILDENGTIKTADFLCHGVLKMDYRNVHDKQHSSLVPSLGYGVTLPAGYGMPYDDLKTSALLRVVTLNLNAAPAFNARYRATVKYISNEDAKKLGLKSIHSLHVSITREDIVAQNRMLALPTETNNMQDDPNLCDHGNPSPNNFIVTPGRHTYTKVFPHDHPIYRGGRIYTYMRHLHAYAESVELIDQTTGKTVLPAAPPEAGDLAASPKTYLVVSIPEGVSIDPSHTYAIRTVYNNTTNESVNGMAQLGLYISGEN